MRRRKAPKNCYWRGEVLWGCYKVKGKLTRWSLRTDDVDVAAARVEAEREQAIAHAHYGDARPRYKDVFAAWGARHITDQVSATTVVRYASSLKQLEPFLIDCYLDQIDSRKITEIVDARRATGAKIATVRRDLGALGSVLKFAIDQGMRDEDDNPALSRAKRLKERRDPIVLAPHPQIARVVKKASATLGPLAAAALRTGCRLSELVTAERTGLDHARRQLTVKGKGNKLRVIDLDVDLGYGTAYDVLRTLPIRLGCKWLFWHHDGKTLRGASGAFYELVRRDLKEAQAEAQRRGMAEGDDQPFRFHDLRHRHAVDWLKAGRSIYDLQQRLGHTSVKTTEIYLKHLTAEEARATMYATGRAESQTESQTERSGG